MENELPEKITLAAIYVDEDGSLLVWELSHQSWLRIDRSSMPYPRWPHRYVLADSELADVG